MPSLTNVQASRLIAQAVKQSVDYRRAGVKKCDVDVKFARINWLIESDCIESDRCYKLYNDIAYNPFPQIISTDGKFTQTCALSVGVGVLASAICTLRITIN